RAAFQERDAYRPTQGSCDSRQVAVVELILQRSCTRRYDHTASRVQRRRKVSERLPRAGFRFYDQPASCLQRAMDELRHRDLIGARREAGQRARKGAFGTEDVLVHHWKMALKRASATPPGEIGLRRCQRMWVY